FFVPARRLRADSGHPESFDRKRSAREQHLGVPRGPPRPSARPASRQTALALQKPRESRERNIGHMMLDALGIEFRALLRNADGAQNIDNEPMPGADTIGEAMPLRRQEHAPIELRGGKPFPFQAEI